MIHPWGSLAHPMGDTGVGAAGRWHFLGVRARPRSFGALWLRGGDAVGWGGVDTGQWAPPPLCLAR